MRIEDGSEPQSASTNHLIFAYYVTGHGFGHATRVVEQITMNTLITRSRYLIGDAAADVTEEDSTGGSIFMLSGSIIGRRRMKRRNKSVQPHKHRVNREVTLPRMVTARQGQYNPLFLLACGLILMLLKVKGGYVGITYLNLLLLKELFVWMDSPPAYHLDKGYGTGVNSWLVHLEVFIDHPSYHRHGIPYGDSFGAFGDNQFRFTLLCHAACEAPLVLPLGGYTHGEKCLFLINDWHAGLVPVLLAARYHPYGVYKDARTDKLQSFLEQCPVFPNAFLIGCPAAKIEGGASFVALLITA
ncbi:hypothetical protein ACFE04_001772 [Oxalis oulophora]